MNTKNVVLLIVVLGAIGSAIVFLQSRQVEYPSAQSLVNGSIALSLQATKKEDKVKRYEPAKELIDPSSFINGGSFKLADYIGKKVILLDFWTYSCINCQRTLPYLNGWYEKYRNEGLLIVGIHTPEFDFEKNIDNVRRAVAQYGIEYPVVLDNNYGTWSSYGNRYWPRKYLIDIDGFVVYDHIGEGSYEETERRIQELLRERKTVLAETGDVAADILRPNAETPSTQGPLSPETYFGASRNLFLGNGEVQKIGLQRFSDPVGTRSNVLYLVGLWQIEPEYAVNQTKGAKVIYQFQAAKVFMVASAETPTTVRVLLDGKDPATAAGSDVRDGTVTVQADQLYRLIELPEGYGEHTLELIVDSPGVQLFTFTFG